MLNLKYASRFLVTRPQPDCKRTADRLRALGHVADEAPLLIFRHEPWEPLGASGVSALAFSSSRAVAALVAGGAIAALRGLPVFAIGRATAGACKDAGFADVRSADGGIEDLGRLILAETDSLRGGTVLYPAARERAGDLEGMLSLGGLSCQTVAVYRMEPAADLPGPAIDLLQKSAYRGISIYSKRTAETFLSLAGEAGLQAHFGTMRIFAISAQAAEPLRDVMPVNVAAEPNEKSLFESMLAEC